MILLTPVYFHNNEINFPIIDCSSLWSKIISNLISFNNIIVSDDSIVNYILIFISFLLISIVLFMLPFGNLLNRSEAIPDWKIEERRRREENERKENDLIQRLRRQCHYDWQKTTFQARDVYDPSFPQDAVLSEELKAHLHARPGTIAFYTLKMKVRDNQWKIYPNAINRTGCKSIAARALDYCLVTGIIV